MALNVDYSDEAEFPKEFREIFENFASTVDNLEKSVQKLTSVALSDTHAQMKPVERAKFDIAPLYAVTSLYWAYLKTKGGDPKTSGIPKELERIKEAMTRTKQIEDKALAPKLDVPAAKRFIGSGLPKNDAAGVAETTASSNGDPSAPPPTKRMRT